MPYADLNDNPNDDDEGWYDDDADGPDDDEPTPCPDCGGPVYRLSDACPKCGYWLSEADRRGMWREGSRPMWVTVTTLVVLAVLILSLLSVGGFF